MSNGFLTVNGNNQVLISSDTKNLHYVGQYIDPTNYIKNETGYGGINIVNYRVYCLTVPVPFFTMPDTSCYYAIGRINQVSSGVWNIEVVKSGSNANYPVLYIFSEPAGATSSGTHGLIVYRDDNSTAFDSRLSPLAITHSFNVSHPFLPRSAIPYGTLEPQTCNAESGAQPNSFIPTNYNTFYLGSALPAEPMFFYASLAQSCIDTSAYHNETFDLFFYKEYEEWWSTYWAFYRGAVKINSSTSILVGWLGINHGCNWRYSRSNSILGVPVRTDNPNGGQPPYNNDTINLDSTSFLIADASRYNNTGTGVKTIGTPPTRANSV